MNKPEERAEIRWDVLAKQWTARLPDGVVVRARSKRILEDFLDWVAEREDGE